MNYSTVYVGMDVHKESFSLCCYTNEKEVAEYPQKVESHYSKVINYIEAMRFHYGDDALFICGYEAGCLGFTLYHQLMNHGVKCIILAPTTMLQQKGRKRVKTDKRDAALIARCLAHRDYSYVHVPTEQDEQTKEFIRMRDDHRLALKKVKQQILSFCLRHNYRFDGTSNHWTQAHLKWLRSLKPEGLYDEVLSEYLLTYDTLSDKIERLDKRIEELAAGDAYQENVKKLSCFIGVKTVTALAVLTEVGDFKRFATAQHFAAYLGLTPGEDSSGDDQTHLGITKAGNRHLRLLLVEAAQGYSRGRIGFKSKALKARQEGNTPEVITYADKANERLRRRYYRMVLHNNKKTNVAKTAIARELACFMWGMVTGNVA
jgi:transposase